MPEQLQGKFDTITPGVTANIPAVDGIYTVTLNKTDEVITATTIKTPENVTYTLTKDRDNTYKATNPKTGLLTRASNTVGSIGSRAVGLGSRVITGTGDVTSGALKFVNKGAKIVNDAFYSKYTKPEYMNDDTYKTEYDRIIKERKADNGLNAAETAAYLDNNYDPLNALNEKYKVMHDKNLAAYNTRKAAEAAAAISKGGTLKRKRNKSSNKSSNKTINKSSNKSKRKFRRTR